MIPEMPDWKAEMPILNRIRSVSDHLYFVNVLSAAVALFLWVAAFLAFWAFTSDPWLSARIAFVLPGAIMLTAVGHSIGIIMGGGE